MPIFPWWWLYPQPPEALPTAVVFPLSSQYLFDVKKDKDKVLVSLQQEDRRKYKKEGKGDNITIGFDILKVGSQQHCWCRACSVYSVLLHPDSEIFGRQSQDYPGVWLCAQTSCGHCTQAMGTQLNLVQLKLYLNKFHLFEKNNCYPLQ